jgi:hypothetical protein
MEKADIGALRLQVAALERGTNRQAVEKTLPFGVGAVDQHLPGLDCRE